MLVLSRKTEQRIAIGPDIVITIVAVKGKRVSIGIEAPESVRIKRCELSEETTDSSLGLETPILGHADSSSGTGLTGLSVAI